MSFSTSSGLMALIFFFLDPFVNNLCAVVNVFCERDALSLICEIACNKRGCLIKGLQKGLICSWYDFTIALEAIVVYKCE